MPLSMQEEFLYRKRQAPVRRSWGAYLTTVSWYVDVYWVELVDVLTTSLTDRC